MGWGKGELSQPDFLLCGEFPLIPIWGPFLSSLPAQAGALGLSRPTASHPSSIHVTREAHQHRVSICGLEALGDLPHGAWGASCRCPSASSPACCPLTGQTPTPAPPASSS